MQVPQLHGRRRRLGKQTAAEGSIRTDPSRDVASMPLDGRITGPHDVTNPAAELRQDLLPKFSKGVYASHEYHTWLNRLDHPYDRLRRSLHVCPVDRDVAMCSRSSYLTDIVVPEVVRITEASDLLDEQRKVIEVGQRAVAQKLLNQLVHCWSGGSVSPVIFGAQMQA